MRKIDFYSNLDTKVVTDKTTLWKTVKPLVSEKVTKHCKINLLQDNKLFLMTTRLLNCSVNTYKYPNFKYAK